MQNIMDLREEWGRKHFSLKETIHVGHGQNKPTTYTELWSNSET